ncbi:hypothetical protein ACFOWE_08980 [Planomonospora corallina]|uniref:Uncharacterized protein n=1 Tax=Planomonospora corallina TaxID=1806052 RepID=A0ABV8I2Q6_9ACTN
MTIIGIVLLAAGLVVAVTLVLADPVLLSRINGEHAEGLSGRHIQAPPVTAGVAPATAEAVPVTAGTGPVAGEEAAGGAARVAAMVPLQRRPGDHEPQAA